MIKARIAETEWKVMEVVWDESPLYSKDILERLADTGWSEGTIKTLINRLVGKKAIGYKKEGKAYRYYPLVMKKQCVQAESKHFINKIFNGSRKEFLAAFVRDEKLTPQEIDELRKLLDKKESE